MAPVDQFIAAIKAQESGGNYSAYNPSGAMGAYQILASNIPVWSKQVLGYSITPQQFLANPALQDQIARAKLTGLFNQYGAQGAASAWYSGNPNAWQSTRAQKGGPSIASYVQEVVSRMGQANESLDLSKQPPNSPISPWQPALTPPASPPTPISASTGLGLEAATGGPLDASTGLGLGAADGTDATPNTPVASKAADGLPPMAGTGGSAVPLGAPSPQAAGLRGAALEMAKKALGTWYVWGGNSLQYGVDCSGLVQQALKSIGINVPRVSYDQLKMGPRESLANAQPGDLIGWGDGHHVAFYLGNGQILEAPHTGAQVRIRQLGANEGTFAVSLANIYH